MPTHRVAARNWAAASDNKIHDDTVARRYGFGGGLVPGVALFAYMARPAAEVLGRSWLGDGTLSARFTAPIYEGEMVETEARPLDQGGGVLELTLRNKAGVTCSEGRAGAGRTGADPTLDDYQVAALPDPDARPPANEETLAVGTVLGTIAGHFRADKAGEYLAQAADDLPLWREGVAHPGWLILSANLILSSNVKLGPWIHVSSDVEMLREVRDGELVVTRGRVADLFERKGHRFVELDLLLTADDEPAWRVIHRAIYDVRPKAAES
jgi:hypothetical protein